MKQLFKTQHFTCISSDKIHEEQINKIAKALEWKYTEISQSLNVILPSHIKVHIYISWLEYVLSTKKWFSSGHIEGIYQFHFIYRTKSEKDIHKTALHEFTHIVVLKLLLDKEEKPVDSTRFDEKFLKFPIWLWEAISCYEAGQFHNPKTISFITTGSYPELDELNSRWSGGKIYKIGYTLIEYILYRYGIEKLITLIIEYGDIVKVFKVSDAEFSKDWFAYIKNKYLNTSF